MDLIIVIGVLYLFIGFIILTVFGGYMGFPPPSRFVEIKDKPGTYKIKDYIPMPFWLWWIVLTIIWLPYILVFLWFISREFTL